jgi:hypothetical protein
VAVLTAGRYSVAAAEYSAIRGVKNYLEFTVLFNALTKRIAANSVRIALDIHKRDFSLKWDLILKQVLLG